MCIPSYNGIIIESYICYLSKISHIRAVLSWLKPPSLTITSWLSRSSEDFAAGSSTLT